MQGVCWLVFVYTSLYRSFHQTKNMRHATHIMRTRLSVSIYLRMALFSVVPGKHKYMRAKRSGGMALCTCSGRCAKRRGVLRRSCFAGALRVAIRQEARVCCALQDVPRLVRRSSFVHSMFMTLCENGQAENVSSNAPLPSTNHTPPPYGIPVSR